MADEIGTKVSQLPLGENLADDDLMYAVEDGVSKKVEVSYLQNRIVGDVDSTPTASSGNLVSSGGVYNMVHTLDFNVFHDLAQISNSIADAFSVSESYSEGDYVVYDYSLYKFTADKSAGAWDFSKATPVAVVEELGSGGTTVVPNPSGEATDTLEKLRIDQTIYDFAASNVYGEASGAIASFSDGSNNPLVKLEADINPIQDLHGYDKPWAGGAGKNKLPYTEKTQTINGATFTINSDGTVSTSGTPTASAFFIYETPTLPVGDYKFFSDADNAKFSPYVYNSTQGRRANNGETFNVAVGDNVTVYLQGRADENLNDQNVTMMICLSTETDATFEPYSNICPISGWSSVEVTVADDTTDPTTEETYEITLGQTAYGGKLNVTTGELTVTHGLLYADGSFNVSNVLYDSSSQLYYTIVKANLGAPANNPLPQSDKFNPYAGVQIGNCYITYNGNYLMAILPDQSADTIAKVTQWFADNPTQFVYELATPTTVTLTPTQVSSLLGSNNIWADSGDVDVVYIRDLNLFLNQLDARVKALENA